jgi:hypothetical protein
LVLHGKPGAFEVFNAPFLAAGRQDAPYFQDINQNGSGGSGKRAPVAFIGLSTTRLALRTPGTPTRL